ncbi:unnamed protein product [Cuscuta europaea]|uniref:Dehydrin n=1 Tax=Cuscuta europaea TaxID=41803 RepID=A0A9P0Z5G1_CUSEU|nr:unnamed protein product [Cuscuta europaea]
MERGNDCFMGEQSLTAKNREAFDFIRKRGGNIHQAEAEAVSGEFEEKVRVTGPPHAAAEHGVEVKKLNRSTSSSSSSSDEETDENGEKKKEKKGLKDKLKKKLLGEPKEEKKDEVVVETSIPVEIIVDDEVEDEKKHGFFGNIKNKLTGGGHKAEEVPEAAAHHQDAAVNKPGFFDKIKEKIHGHHPKMEEEKEKEK